MKLLAAVLLVLCLAGVRPSPLTSQRTASIEYVNIILMEEPCVRQGGWCVREQDCDPSNLSQVRGVLCPLQKDQGIECCYQN